MDLKKISNFVKALKKILQHTYVAVVGLAFECAKFKTRGQWAITSALWRRRSSLLFMVLHNQKAIELGLRLFKGQACIS